MREAPVAEATDRLLRTEEVAKWLAVSKSTLVRWRQSGYGPDVFWLAEGVPRYRGLDIERWLTGRTAARPASSWGRVAHAHSSR
ncbi:MAG TPA: helix-turn-helix domain-containing protein [Galbitalea sp.]|nr:helix-turn-helix domain-containing protein [Galbitalea sp.]